MSTDWKPIFASTNDKHCTPIDVYRTLNAEFNFDFDPCPKNPDQDGLVIDWGKRNFVNPPYSELAEWAKKSVEQWHKGKLVVMLVPSRTDTKYWHEYIMKATELRFIKGRLKFTGAKGPAPFASCIVIFR